jgi:RNA polymerase sigma-70 factor (ECF subfamily)
MSTTISTEWNSSGPSASRHDAEWSRLMAAAQVGDAKAYDSLLDQIRPLIRKIATSTHRNADRAEDVVQDVLLSVHSVRHTYDPSRPFSHWLAAIARHRSVDALRRRTRIDRSEVSDDATFASFPDPLAGRAVEVRETADELKRAIATLTLSQRTALELVKLRGMTLAEASRETGKSVVALKVAVHRAIKTLRLRYARDARLGGEDGHAERRPRAQADAAGARASLGRREGSRPRGFPDYETYQSCRPMLPALQSAGSCA